MTVEIQELIIQGRVVTPEETALRPSVRPKSPPIALSDEERWIERIKSEVFEQLREQGWEPR